MGGKNGDQVAGYQYFTNLVVMIGNRIEELKAINFDKRGWILNTEQRINKDAKMKFDGDYSFAGNENIYGKDEGGIAGSVGLRLGNPSPAADPAYAEYLESKGFPALAYPYLSYLIMKGQNNEGFYVGNNPYLKEMMLWPKRIYVRNDGREQWHHLKAGIPDFFYEGGGDYQPNLDINVKYTGFDFNIPVEKKFSAINQHAWNNAWSISGQITTNGPINYPYPVRQDWEIKYSSGEALFIEFGVNIMNNDPNVKADITLFQSGNIQVISIDSWDGDIPPTYGAGQFKRLRAVLPVHPNGKAIITVSGSLEAGLVSWHKGGLKWEDPVKGQTWIEEMEATDINPIHKIREILTDDTAMNIPESEMNDEIFIRAADQIWDERLGISAAFTEKNCKEALDDICAHIEAGVRVNRQTGKYEVILFRDNWYDLSNALHFDQSNIKRGSFSVEVMNTDDAINVLNVNYYDRNNIKDSSFNVYENGLIQTMGRENAETVDFPYFMNQRNAEVVANWKLKQLSTPAWRGSFSTSHRAARKLNRFDIITVTWPSKQIYYIPMRVMKINLGTATDTAVTIDFVEVVPYSNELSSSIVVDPPVSVVLPPQPTNPTVFEVPYYALVQLLGQREADTQLEYNPEMGYLGVSAQKPQSNSLNALLYTGGGTGDYTQFEKVAVVDYNQGIYLDQGISQLDASFAVIDLDYVRNGAPKFTGVPVGTIGQINDELISFVAYDSETKILTVKRGVLDSVPTKHTSDLIHFWGESFAYDSNEYVMGEMVGAQVLTTTPSGVEELDPTKLKEVEMNARAIRPYPPANVKFNDSYYPETLIISNDIVLTWVDRNRVQQTGGQILGFYDAGVTIENGVRYSYELISENSVLDSQSNITTNSVTILASLLKPNKPHTFKLWSVRVGYESYQKFEHSFFAESASLILTATTNGAQVIGNTVPAANINVDVDTTLKANMQFDGSKITGKSQPGATITIEVEE